MPLDSLDLQNIRVTADLEYKIHKKGYESQFTRREKEQLLQAQLGVIGKENAAAILDGNPDLKRAVEEFLGGGYAT
jgi:hypothetical protein